MTPLGPMLLFRLRTILKTVDGKFYPTRLIALNVGVERRNSFRYNTLVTVSNPITPIPFVDAESQEASKALKSEIKPFARILKIKARTRQPIAIDVSNSEIHQGYLPRIDTPEGLYIGEAAVTAQDGKCHVLAINTTEQDIEFNVPPQEIIPFDFCRFPGEKFSESETEDLS